MIKRKILIGFLTGIFANSAGIFLYISFFSEMNLASTIKDAVKNDYLGKVIALGAALNFLPFFIFLKKDQIYQARGVILASLLSAITIAVIKFL
ncbi:hypothetical protein ACKGJN_01295 [Gillisia sp. Q332]|uniref:hypothetical protein n=1 Tax=Gillisia xinjiangensis TaxID=3384765 RepID=UPI00391DF54E